MKATTLIAFVGLAAALAPPPHSAPLVRVRVRLEPRRHGEGRRHARLVAEPAHSLRRHDEDAGRLDAGMGAAAARQPADLPQRELDRADGTSRLHGQRERQLGARGREEAVRHVHHARQRPGERPQARPLRECGHDDADHRRSERRLHRAREELPREHHGLLGQSLQIPRDRRRLRAEADAAHARGDARSTTAASTATTRCCAVCPRVCRASSARRIRCRSSTPARTI